MPSQTFAPTPPVMINVRVFLSGVTSIFPSSVLALPCVNGANDVRRRDRGRTRRSGPPYDGPRWRRACAGVGPAAGVGAGAVVAGETGPSGVGRRQLRVVRPTENDGSGETHRLTLLSRWTADDISWPERPRTPRPERGRNGRPRRSQPVKRAALARLGTDPPRHYQQRSSWRDRQRSIHSPHAPGHRWGRPGRVRPTRDIARQSAAPGYPPTAIGGRVPIIVFSLVYRREKNRGIDLTRIARRVSLAAVALSPVLRRSGSACAGALPEPLAGPRRCPA